MKRGEIKVTKLRFKAGFLETKRNEMDMVYFDPLSDPIPPGYDLWILYLVISR
jgi:hypothetical protein